MINPRILVPPGIGDIYWVLVKLPALMKRYGWKRPELTILSNPDDRGGYLRAIPYLKMFDWVSIGEPQSIPNKPELRHIYDEAYLGSGHSIFENVHEYDYFIAYNGRVNSGGYIENDDVACDWYPKMSFDYEAVIGLATEISKALDDRMALMFWPFYGSYESHLADFGIEKIAEALNAFLRKYNLVPVYVGSKWDDGLNPKVRELMKLLPVGADLIGKTELHTLFALAKAAKIATGYHAGITQMAAVFGTKTLCLWDDRYPPTTSWAVVPPECRGRNYVAIETRDLTPDDYFTTLCTLYESKI